MRRGAAQHRGEGLLDRDDLDRMLMRDERANKDQESRAIRAIRARPGLAARGAQLPAKYHNGAVVLQHPELLFPHHVSRHMVDLTRWTSDTGTLRSIKGEWQLQIAEILHSGPNGIYSEPARPQRGFRIEVARRQSSWSHKAISHG